MPKAVFKQPWTALEFPHVTAWLESQRAALACGRRAADCSRMFLPIVRSGKTPMDNLLRVNFSIAAEDIGDALLCRALFKVGSGHLKAGWRDIEAVHKLSILIDQGQFQNTRLIGMRIDASVLQTVQSLAKSEKLSATQARWCLSRMQRWPSPPSLAQCSIGIRLRMLAFIQGWAHYGFHYPWREPNYLVMAFTPIDYNALMQRWNAACDQLAAALKMRSYQAAQTAISAISARYWDNPLGTNLSPWLSRRRNTRQLAVSLIPAGVGVCMTLNFVAMEQAEKRLTEAALALAAYHATYHRYPHSLHALVPTYLSVMPKSRFNGKPLHYCTCKHHDGYLLYYFSLMPGDKGRWWRDEEETLSMRWSNPPPPRFKGLSWPPPTLADLAEFPSERPITCPCKLHTANKTTPAVFMR